jgi:hypothetical protein
MATAVQRPAECVCVRARAELVLQKANESSGKAYVRNDPHHPHAMQCDRAVVAEALKAHTHSSFSGPFLLSKNFTNLFRFFCYIKSYSIYINY